MMGISNISLFFLVGLLVASRLPNACCSAVSAPRNHVSRISKNSRVNYALSTATIDRCSRLAQEAIKATTYVTRPEEISSYNYTVSRTSDDSEIFPPANYNEYFYSSSGFRSSNFGPYSVSSYTRSLGSFSMRVWYPNVPNEESELIPVVVMFQPVQVRMFCNRVLVRTSHDTCLHEIFLRY